MSLSEILDFFRDFDNNVKDYFAPGWEQAKVKLLENFSLVVYISSAILPLALVFIVLQDHWDIEYPQPIGCTRVGLTDTSNLDDEHLPEHSGDPPSEINKVKALCIYPIKSCTPVEVEQSEIVRTGLRYDREFSFARYDKKQSESEGQWRFLTQRECPRLALVKVQLWVPNDKSPLFNSEREVIKNGGCLIISFPYHPDSTLSWEGLQALLKTMKAKYIRKRWNAQHMIYFEIPFLPTVQRMEAKSYGPTENMLIWKDNPASINMEKEIPPDVLAKLRHHLGVKEPLTLFRVDTTNYREVFRCAPRKEDVGYQPIVGFADAYPLHLLNIASIQDLARRLPEKHRDGFSVIRFRGNIITTGPAPNAEQDWKRIRINGREYHVSCRTIRCKMPNVDPDTAILDRNEPYTTMAKYRCIDDGLKTMPALGMQVVPMDGELGLIRVGDQVEVLETGYHRYIKQ